MERSNSLNALTSEGLAGRRRMSRGARFIAPLLGLSVVLAACGGAASTPATSDAAATTAPTTAPATDAATSAPESAAAVDLTQYIGNPDKALCGGREWTFGYDTFSDTEEFAVQFWNGMQQVADQLGCVKIHKLSDNLDPATAVQNAKIFVQQQVDGVFLFNVLEAAGPGVAQVLDQAGIPAASIVIETPNQLFVTNDDFPDGQLIGKGLCDAYAKSGKTGDVYGVVGRFDGQGPTGVARMDGAVDGLKGCVAEANLIQFETKADPPTAQSGMAAVLGKIPAGATILMTGINDQIANAMYQAVKQAGREADSMVVPIGAVNPGGLQFICQNQPAYVGAVAFFPENWPDYLIPALMAQIQGADVPHKTIVPTKFITADEISTIYPDFQCGSN
jgi:ribose transport system substrate-binding protein